MGRTIRVFFIAEDDSLRRIPVARFDRLTRHPPSERFPEYAGKLVKCATVVVETMDRRAVAITHIDYSFIGFDSQGYVDASRDLKAMEIIRGLAPSPFEDEPSNQVIRAKSRFLKKRYEHEFKWVPSRELESAIIEAVFPDQDTVPF